MELNRKNVRTIMLIIVFAVAIFNVMQNLGAVYSGIKSVIGVFSTVISGLAAAFVINIPLRGFENRVFRSMKEGDNATLRKLSRPLALLCSLALILGIVVILIMVIVPQISTTVADLSVKLPGYVNTALEWSKEKLLEWGVSPTFVETLTIDWESALGNITNLLREGWTSVLDTVRGIGATLLSSLTQVAFSVIIALYVLGQKEKIGAFVKRCVNALLPERISRQVLRIAALTNETFSNFASGQITEAIVLGVLAYLGMKLFRFPYPEVISIMIGVLNLIPILGGLVSATVGTLLIFFVSPLKALLFLIFIVCLQQLENSLIYPRVVGKSVGIPGLLVFCAVMVGENVAGVVGALTSVPICAILFTLLRELLAANEARPPAAEEKSKAENLLE